MPKVFLSYSRKDQTFVRRLHDSLEQAGRDAWVDWSDIPPTTEFMREIIDGIAASDTFVSILSPDYAVSKVCGEEIDCACGFKKRLIPVLYRDVPANQVHPALASHNWISFRETEDFANALKVLLDSIDTDLALAEMHTRLLVRARDWEANGCRPSLVLSGKDLDDAEQWLLASAGKRPSPLPIHAQYIAASRKVARQRYRQLLYTSVVGLVFTILLSFFLLLSIQTAKVRNDILKDHLTLEAGMQQTIDAAFSRLTQVAPTPH